MKKLFYRFASSRSFAKLLSVLAFAALGFIYSSDAYASVVLHGIDGGSTSGDGKFVWDKKCVDTVTKVVSTTCTNAPTIGYLYRGPTSGKFYRTGTCWSKSLNKEVACSTATGFITSSFTHHGIRIECGDADPFTVTLGAENPSEQLMTVEPGEVGSPAKVNIDIGQTTCAGFDVSLPSTDPNFFLGEGDFQYHVDYEISVATSSDLNKGGGNEACGKCDPDNPGSGGKKGPCTGCQVNQTCTNLSATESRFTIKAFCQAGVKVTGFLKWLDPNPALGDVPPAFTNCVADATDCILQLGGLPLTSKGTVDATLCAQFFPALDVLGDPNKHLDLRQLLLFQQNYTGQCLSATLADFGLEDPQGKGLHRECNSDYGPLSPNQGVPRLAGEGFDNVFRGCVVEDNAFHVVQGAETARSREVAVDVTPQSVNLRCGSDPAKDQGVITAAICGTIDFDVNQVALGSKPKLLDLAPVLFVEGGTTIVRPIGFNIAVNTGGECSGDTFQDLNLIYKSCNSDGTGVAQAILKDAAPQNDHDPVTLILQGQEKPNGTPVILQGSDIVEVVNVPAP